MEPLEGARLKVSRVKEQLDLLLLDFSHFLQDDAYTVRQEIDGNTGEHVLFYECGEMRPPISWSVRIGEMLYDLRSALDHFVWELVCHDGGKPGRHTEFPIIRNAERYFASKAGGGMSKLKGVGSAGHTFIEHLQPYHAGNGVKPLHPLYVLHRLSIIDKHRYLNLTCSLVKLGKIRLTPKRGGGSIQLNAFTNVRLEGRAEICRVGAFGPPTMEVEMEFPHAIEIAFDDVPLVRRRLVKEVFAVLIQEVDKVLAAAQRDLFTT